MTKVYIKKLNEVYARVDSDDLDVVKAIYSNFTVESNVNPFVLRNMPDWDGKLHLYNGKTRSMYIGLLPDLLAFLKDYNNVKVEYNDFDFFGCEYDLSAQDVNKIINDLDIHSGGMKIQPREHQLVALLHVLRTSRAVVISPTGSGKSYIIYVLLRFLHAMQCNILLVVPNLSLIQQMLSDFKDYSSTDNDFTVSKEISICTGGQKISDKNITLANWQAIYKLPQSFFNKYTAVIVDEVHLAQAESLKGIMQKCLNAHYRYGFTGTLQETKTHISIIEGLFGRAVKFTSSKKLMNAGILSPLLIKMVFLQYSENTKIRMRGVKYHDEVIFASTNENKRKFVVALADKVKGNVLVLVHLIKEHAVPLYKDMKENTQKKVLFISGATKAEDRERIRKIMEQENNCVLIATYGTTATGVNIKNLHHIIFASAFKSKIRVLQSIGRELRTSSNKEKAILWDLVDDLSVKGSRGRMYQNYLLTHAQKRLQTYKDEKFDFEIIQKKIER